jgi:hypothetical protein
MGEKTWFFLQLQQRCKVVVKIKPCVPFCRALQGCCAALDYNRAFATAESRRSMMPADIRAEKRVAMGGAWKMPKAASWLQPKLVGQCNRGLAVAPFRRLITGGCS